MSIEERAAVAAELKATGKCNCTQSVVKVFAVSYTHLTLPTIA